MNEYRMLDGIQARQQRTNDFLDNLAQQRHDNYVGAAEDIAVAYAFGHLIDRFVTSFKAGRAARRDS